MPLNNKNSSEPPKVMTWSKATPVLLLSLVFDALRAFFDFFWLFGPAVAAIYCTSAVNDALGTSVSGLIGKGVALGCSAVAGVVGVAGIEVTVVFGTVMAIAVGLLGWLTVGTIVLITDARVIRENMTWFITGFMISEMPLIGALPMMTVSVWRMYHRQIKAEKAALLQWQKENEAMLRQQQEQQMAYLMELQAAQEAEFAQQEAANEELYADQQALERIREDEQNAEAQFEEQEAANDAVYDTVRKAA